MVLEKILKSPLDSKEIKPVNPKRNQSWIFIGRTDAEAEALILWPLMQRANSLKKTLMLGKIESRRKRGRQRIRWLDGTTNSMDMSLSSSGRWWWTGKPGILQPRGRKESDTTEQLNWTEPPHQHTLSSSISLPGTSYMGLGELVAKIYKEIL